MIACFFRCATKYYMICCIREGRNGTCQPYYYYISKLFDAQNIDHSFRRQVRNYAILMDMFDIPYYFYWGASHRPLDVSIIKDLVRIDLNWKTSTHGGHIFWLLIVHQFIHLIPFQLFNDYASKGLHFNLWS